MAEHFGRRSDTVIHPNDDVNKSQSSNDTFPTGMHIASYKMVVETTIPRCGKTQRYPRRQEQGVYECGKDRSHPFDGRDATYCGAGTKRVCVSAIRSRIYERCETHSHHLSEVALGWHGCGYGYKHACRATRHLVAEEDRSLHGPSLLLRPRISLRHWPAHDAIVESHGALKQLAVSLMKIGNDIRLLASGPRCGIGELIIPENEPGSSIMPGKVNPTQCEALTMVCAQVIGNDVAVTTGGMNGHFELNVFKPMMAFNLLMSARLIGDACVSFNDNCAVGIEPNHARIKQNLDNSLMLVTALNTKIGYEAAAKIAKTAHKNGTTLKEESVNLGYLTAEEFDQWVDPSKMIGSLG